MNLREGRGALLAGIVLHLLFIGSLFGQYLNPLFAEAERSFGQAADYYGIYTAGEDLLHGRSIYSGFEDHSGAIRRVPYFYFFRYLPPTAYFAALTALVMSPMAGYVLWVILTELLLLLAIRSILRLEQHPVRERRFHAALWLGFFPFYLEQWMGQFSFLMAFFLWIMLRRFAEDRAGSASRRIDGGGLGTRAPAFWAWAGSVALKSYTVLFAISFLRRRRYRPVLLCAGVVLLTCLPYWIAHPADIQRFLLLNLRPLPPGIHGGTLGASALIRLAGWMLPTGIAGRRIVIGDRDLYWGNAPVLASGFFILAIALWVVWRHGKKAPLDLQMGLWVLCFFLIFKDIWEYHYVMLLPVVTTISLAHRSRFVFWMGILLAAPTPYALFAGPDHAIPVALNLVHHASKALPTLALFVWVLARCSGGSRAGNDETAAAWRRERDPASDPTGSA